MSVTLTVYENGGLYSLQPHTMYNKVLNGKLGMKPLPSFHVNINTNV